MIKVYPTRNDKSKFAEQAKTKVLRLLLLIILVANISVTGHSQVTIWSEDFETYSDNDGHCGAGGADNQTANPAVDWTNDALCSGSDYFRVESSSITPLNGSYSFAGKDLDGQYDWLSESIDITGYTNVTVSVLYYESDPAGNLNNGDDIEMYYNIGAGWISFAYKKNDMWSGAQTATIAGLSGTSLQVRVRMDNDDNDEIWIFDDVVVQGTVPPPACNPCYSIASDDYNVSSTWSNTSGGASCGCLPDNNSEVIIERGYSVSLTTNDVAGSLEIGTANGSGELEWDGNYIMGIYNAAGVTVASNGTINNNGNNTAKLDFDNNSGALYLLDNEGTFDIGSITVSDATLTMSGSSDIHLDGDLLVGANDAVVTNNNTGWIIIDDDVDANNYTLTLNNNGNIYVDDDVRDVTSGEVGWYNYANAYTTFNEDVDTDLFIYANYSLNTIEYNEGGGQDIIAPQDAYWHLILEGGGTKLSRGDFSISGDFTINATWDDGDDVHTFSGANNQQITGSTSPATFYSIAVNKDNTLTSDVNLTIDNELQIDAGTFLMDGETVDCETNIDINGGTLQITAGALNQNQNDDTSFDQDGGTFDIDGGTVTLGALASDADQDYNLDGGVLDVSGGTIHISDALDMNGGSLVQSGGIINVKAHTGTGSGDQGPKLDVSAGAVTITNGNLNVMGAYDHTVTYPGIEYNPTTSTITGGTISCEGTGTSDEEFYVNFNGNYVYNFEVDKTTGTSTTTIWTEDFESYADNDGHCGAGGADNQTTNPAVDWTNDALCSGSDYFRVESSSITPLNGSRSFAGKDLDGQYDWLSESIDITGYTNVTVSILYYESNPAGNLNNDDDIEMFYNIGAGWVSFEYKKNDMNSGAQTATVSGLTGTSLQIRVRMENDDNDEIWIFDDVVVEDILTTDGLIYLSSNLDVDNDLTMTDLGGIDVTTNYQVNVGGDWSNNSSIADAFVEQNGMVIFDGGAAQQLTHASGSETFYNLKMSNGVDELTLNDPSVVTNVLTLTAGNIITDAVNLLTLTDNAISSAGSNGSFVDGPMKKIGDDAFDFPVGDDGIWRRIGISAPTMTTTEYTGEFINATHTDANNVSGIVNVSQHDYWDLSQGVNDDDVKVELFWENATASQINDCNDITVAHYHDQGSGDKWYEEVGNFVVGSNCGDAGTGSVMTDAVVTSYSPFSFGSQSGTSNYLPIELIGFNAVPNEKTVELSWETASEINNDYFVIERSADGLDFKPVVEVEGAGNSSSIIDYFEIDFEPLMGQSYYRLKQVDFDGKFTYSNVVVVQFENDEEDQMFSVFPNPTNQANINISLSGFENQDVLVVLRDITGKEYYSKVRIIQSDNHMEAISLDCNMAAGVYLIVASSNNNIYSKKLIIREKLVNQ